jgi:hypothetical protein
MISLIRLSSFKKVRVKNMENTDDLIEKLYRCRICGHTSSKMENVIRCASQGRKNLYQIGQKVEFHFVGMNNCDLRKIWFRAEIKNIHYGNLNHRVSYTILLTDSDLPPPYHGREMKIPEPYVRPIEKTISSKSIELDKK